MATAIRWTPEQLAAYRARTAPTPKPTKEPEPAPKKRSKYGSRKVEQDGEKYDSKKEARRALALERMQAAGLISDLKRQVPFELAPAVRLDGEARMKPAIRFIADFTYVQNGQLVVEDVKSAPTRKLAVYRMKRHLMATIHGLQIKEV